MRSMPACVFHCVKLLRGTDPDTSDTVLSSSSVSGVLRVPASCPWLLRHPAGGRQAASVLHTGKGCLACELEQEPQLTAPRCAGGLRDSGAVDHKEQRGEREPELDPGQHEAVPQVQAADREEPGLHAHDVQPVQVRVLLALPGLLGGAWRAHRRLLRLQPARPARSMPGARVRAVRYVTRMRCPCCSGGGARLGYYVRAASGHLCVGHYNTPNKLARLGSTVSAAIAWHVRGAGVQDGLVCARHSNTLRTCARCCKRLLPMGCYGTCPAAARSRLGPSG